MLLILVLFVVRDFSSYTNLLYFIITSLFITKNTSTFTRTMADAVNKMYQRHKECQKIRFVNEIQTLRLKLENASLKSKMVSKFENLIKDEANLMKRNDYPVTKSILAVDSEWAEDHKSMPENYTNRSYKDIREHVRSDDNISLSIDLNAVSQAMTTESDSQKKQETSEEVSDNEQFNEENRCEYE